MLKKKRKVGSGWFDHFGADHPTAKKVIQKDKSGKALNVWDSVSLAASHMHVNKGNITKACQNRRKTAGGFIWAYKYPTMQRCYQYDKAGDLIRAYNTMIVASHHTRARTGDILKCCQGEKEFARGFVWSFTKKR